MSVTLYRQVIATCDRCGAKQNIELGNEPSAGYAPRPRDWRKFNLGNDVVGADLCAACVRAMLVSYNTITQ
jgi:hypothetical protein